MFSLSSRSTLLIRNQLEVQVFSFPKCCKGVCCWWSGSFPVGRLGPPRSLYADRNDPCLWWGCHSLESEFGNVFEILFVRIMHKHMWQDTLLFLGSGGVGGGPFCSWFQKWISWSVTGYPGWKDSKCCGLKEGRALNLGELFFLQIRPLKPREGYLLAPNHTA